MIADGSTASRVIQVEAKVLLQRELAILSNKFFSVFIFLLISELLTFCLDSVVYAKYLGV